MSLHSLWAYAFPIAQAAGQVSFITAARRLKTELAAWRLAGRRAALWWRDDDAQMHCRALQRLLGMSDRHGVPLLLAVIPTGDCAAVAEQVGVRPLVRLAQHGVDHHNRRGPDETGEFPLEWSRELVARRLEQGWSNLQSLDGAIAVFVPPWNNVHPDLPAVLEAANYIGWSAARGDSLVPGEAGPPRLDADVDVLAWRGGPHFKGVAAVFQDLAAALKARRLAECWNVPVGILTHHLVHDMAVWLFLEGFFWWTRREPLFEWRSFESLVVEERLARTALGGADGAVSRG